MKNLLLFTFVLATAALPTLAAAAYAPGPQVAHANSVFRNYVGFVEAKIGEEGSFWFLVDTGANRSAIDSSVAADLGLEKRGSTTVQGSAGSIEVKSVRLPQLSIGGLVARNINPTVYDLSGSLAPEGQKIAGIIGFDVMKDVAVLFDTANGRLRFASAAEMFGSLDGAAIVPFELDNNIPRVNVRIDGIPVQLRLDTGASIGPGETTFVNIAPGFYEILKTRNPDLKPVRHFTASGAGGVIRIPVLQGKSLEIGASEIEEPQLIVQQPVGYFANKDAVGFLGSYSLRAFSSFIVDYPGKRLILFPKDAAAKE